MKQLLLLIFLGSAISLHAQCVNKNSEASEEQVFDSPVVYNEMVQGKDFSGDYVLKGFIIGGGISSGIFSSGIGPESTGGREFTRYTNNQWNHLKPAGFLELMYEFDTRREIIAGFSGSWSTLWENQDSYSEVPPSGGQIQNGPFGLQEEVPQEDLYTLNWNFKQNVKLSNFMFFTDVEFLRLNKRLYLFARPEIGFSSYANRTAFNFKDSCDCDQSAGRTLERKTTFTSGLAVGISWGNGIFQLRSILGYRVYNPIGFSSKDYVSKWQGRFDESLYDFQRNPSGDLFYVEKPGVPELIGRRNGVLYFQLGIYLNLGEILN